MAPSLNIPKEILVDLYQKERLSAVSIARKLNIHSHVTILNYLKKYNIPRRSRLGNRISINISKVTLIDLYQNKRLTQKSIAQRYGNKSYTGISRLMKFHGIKARNYSQAHTKYPKFDFKGNLIDKAYLIGFRIGDLNVYKIKNLIQVRCSTTIQAQVDLIKTLFNSYGNVHIWKARRGTFEIIVLLNESFDFLLPKVDRIENWILKNKDLFLAFMAGYIDAEGSYYIRKPYHKTHKPSWAVFEIQSYDKNIVELIYWELKRLGVGCTFSVNSKRTFYKKDMNRITISRKQALWNFIKLIEPFQRHQAKLKDLNKVKDNIISRNYIPHGKPIIL